MAFAMTNNSMNLIALDTCTEACSAALWLNGEVSERYQIAPREHTRLILPMLDELLAEAEMTVGSFDAIAFGRGPGAFTGVRIGIGVTQGIAFAADIPVVPVSTLAALAQDASSACEEGDAILAVIDARMAEVYWGLFTPGADGVVVPLLDEGIAAPLNLPSIPSERVWGVGSGWGSYREQLSIPFGQRLLGADGERFPRARAIAALGAAAAARGELFAAESAEPIYLRDKVAKTTAERMQHG